MYIWSSTPVSCVFSYCLGVYVPTMLNLYIFYCFLLFKTMLISGSLSKDFLRFSYILSETSASPCFNVKLFHHSSLHAPHPHYHIQNRPYIIRQNLNMALIPVSISCQCLFYIVKMSVTHFFQSRC